LRPVPLSATTTFWFCPAGSVKLVEPIVTRLL
jgi:hypothetical protein